MFSFWSTSAESKPAVSVVDESTSSTKQAIERKRTFVEEEGEEIIIREVDTLDERDQQQDYDCSHPDQQQQQQQQQDETATVTTVETSGHIDRYGCVDDTSDSLTEQQQQKQHDQYINNKNNINRLKELGIHGLFIDEEKKSDTDYIHPSGMEMPSVTANTNTVQTQPNVISKVLDDLDKEFAAMEQDNDHNHDDDDYDSKPLLTMEPTTTTDELDEEVDLTFVETFDNAFNEFLAYNPDFLIQSPDLVHNLRVTKLQKLLQRQDNRENELRSTLQAAEHQKNTMEANLHHKLRDAARIKAARETHLQSHLNEIHYSTKSMEAQLTWHMIEDSAQKSKTQFELQQALQNKPIGDDRMELLSILPDDVEFQDIRNNILAPGESESIAASSENGQGISDSQENDMRQLQMDIAFLNAEVSVLERKLNYQTIAGKKNAWVESILLRMDEETIVKLKARFQKKTGVPI